MLEYPVHMYDAGVFIAQLILALEVLHRLRIIYLNIRPENILVDKVGHIMLTDFSQSYCPCYANKWPHLKRLGGDLYYMAPEIANEIAITPKADIWQLGMLAATLVAGNIRPAGDKSKLLEMAKRGIVQIRDFAFLPKYFRSFVDACLTKNHETRPNVDELKYFQFVVKSNIAVLTKKNVLDVEPITLNCFDPSARNVLNAAFDKGFPNVTYILETKNGVRKEGLLPYTGPNLSDLKNSHFSIENLKHIPDFAEYPDSSQESDCENEGSVSRHSKKPRIS
nr:ribosomal protein S6 kinase alpha 6 [Hymenolepis microstoma]